MNAADKQEYLAYLTRDKTPLCFEYKVKSIISPNGREFMPPEFFETSNAMLACRAYADKHGLSIKNLLSDSLPLSDINFHNSHYKQGQKTILVYAEL